MLLLSIPHSSLLGQVRHPCEGKESFGLELQNPQSLTRWLASWVFKSACWSRVRDVGLDHLGKQGACPTEDFGELILDVSLSRPVRLRLNRPRHQRELENAKSLR
jgi:hypothetical protein